MYHIIVNPASKSQRGLKVWKELKEHLQNEYIVYQVYFTTLEKNASFYSRQITSDTTEDMHRIIVLGGDGTVNEVLNGIVDFEHTVLTYLPAGSSNDLARDLFVKSDPADALFRSRQKIEPRCMDYGIVNSKGLNRRFSVSCGIGYDAAICEEVQRSKLKHFFNKIGLGKLVYGVIGVKQLIGLKQISCDLYLDDATEPIHFNNLILSTFMVHRYEGGGFCFCPDADYNDGLLDICLIGNISNAWALTLIIACLLGKHTGRKGVYHYRAKKIRIVTDQPLFVHTDGEIPGKFTEISLNCEKNALKFI